MRTPRRSLLTLLLVCCAAAGCGSDSSNDQASSTTATPAAKPSAAAVASVTELQQAASDLVRESSLKDKPGTTRAIKAYETAFAEARDAIEKAAPASEEEIKLALAEAKSELARGDLAGVSRAAGELLNATNEASAAVTGKPAGSKAGLASVMQDINAAARDVEQEVEASDKDGTERAYRAVAKLYAASREQVKETSPEADRDISRALAELKSAVNGGDKEKLKEAAEGLVKAVGEAPGGGGGAAPEAERTKCKAASTSKPTGLPSGFPTPEELTITEASKAGPTTAVDGYFKAPFDETYKEFNDAVKRAGYQVLPSEKEAHDAEINYKGAGRTGQIALRDDCTESDTTRIHITSRPA